MAKDTQPQGAKSQSERFKEAARELGCDESEARFDEALKKVGRHKLSDENLKRARSPSQTILASEPASTSRRRGDRRGSD